MKKLTIFALMIAMVLCVTGCGGQTEGKIGDTLKAGNLEITLTSFGFAQEGVIVDKDQPDIFCTPTPFPYALTGNEAYDNFVLQAAQSTYVMKTEETCVVYLEYTVKNNAKDDLIAKMILPRIQFGDSEAYPFDLISPLLLEDGYNTEPAGVHFYLKNDRWESSPLYWFAGQEHLCRGVAKLPVDVETKTDTPLLLHFNVPVSNDNYETLTFTIR